MTNKFTLIIFTHNSATKLKLPERFLGVFDELIAIDDLSTDGTIKILSEKHFEVFSIPFDGDFAKRHNLAASKSSNSWIFFLDDDEAPSDELIDTINHLKTKDISGVAGYSIKRIDKVMGEYINHGEHGNIVLTRLTNKDKGVWTRSVHEYFKTTGVVQEIGGLILHDQGFSVERFLDKANFYAPIDAAAFKKDGGTYSGIELLKPPAKFVKNYIFLLGFLDGYRGMFLSYLMAFQSLLVRIYQWEIR